MVGFVLFIWWVNYWRNLSKLKWCKTHQLRCWAFHERHQKLSTLAKLNRPQLGRRWEHLATLKKQMFSSSRGLLGACLSVRAGKHSAGLLQYMPVLLQALVSFWSWAAECIVCLLPLCGYPYAAISSSVDVDQYIDFIGSNWGSGGFLRVMALLGSWD